jgi:RNA recognition motif-containing protein
MSGTEGDQMVETMTNTQETTETKLEYDPNENPAGKLFIGGLSWQTTEDGRRYDLLDSARSAHFIVLGLRYYFEKFGELTDVALMTDKRTMQPRGFGFVSFKDPAGIHLSG